MRLQSAHYALNLSPDTVLYDRELAEEFLAPLQPERGRPSLDALRRIWLGLKGAGELPTCPAGLLSGVFGHLKARRGHLSHLYLIRDGSIPVFIPVAAYDQKTGRRRDITALIRSMQPCPGDTVIAVMDHRAPGTDPGDVLHALKMV